MVCYVCYLFLRLRNVGKLKPKGTALQSLHPPLPPLLPQEYSQPPDTFAPVSCPSQSDPGKPCNSSSMDSTTGELNVTDQTQVTNTDGVDNGYFDAILGAVIATVVLVIPVCGGCAAAVHVQAQGHLPH
ncbi:hypothetical protein AALO_G00046050 [Alosa alosa]|uniref:Uncharacterized protein n=1 Tax=Alosa alosa TaxID=278164 RepID=A0AAV6HB56_9TELE|nr:hypothetical protein AALO_G00046050 [Alosa alosa]